MSRVKLSSEAIHNDFIDQTSEYVRLWNKHGPMVDVLSNRRSVVKTQKEKIIYSAARSVVGDQFGMPSILDDKVDAALANVPPELMRPFLEQEVLNLALSNIRAIRTGMATRYSHGTKIKVHAEAEGVTVGNSLGLIGASRSYAAELAPTKRTSQRPVEPGTEFFGEPLYVSTVPEFGGKIIIAGLLRHTHIEGLVDPETAEPRASLEVFRPVNFGLSSSLDQ